MILLGNPCNFHTLSLNNLASSSADVFSVVEIKYTIFINLSTTTKIELYPYTSGNLVMKFTEIWAQDLYGIKFGINFPAGCSVQFLLYWHIKLFSIYCFTSFMTPGHQKFLVTNSTVFYCPLCPPTSISWYNQIISALSFLSFSMYIFSFLYIILSTSLYSLSLSIFTFACFISFTALIISLSFTFNCFTFSSKSTSSTITSTFSVFLTSNHSGFTNISFSLSFSIPIS